MLFTRKKPFCAKIKERFALTKPGSTKETYHVVLDIKDSDMEFKVGDSIGILAQNDPVLVQRMIASMGASGDEQILEPRTNEPMTLRDFLTHKANLSRYEEHGISLQDLNQNFAPLLPRFYSVASSPKTHPEEVHLTVTLSTYTYNGELRYGVASHFLCHLAREDSTLVPSYVQVAPHFMLPHDDAPIIMVGPGTGVAPFRGFMQERLARAARGKNWLFFGERHRAFDFFYEEFWTPLATDNKLKLDLAFSRDQADKVYVQHKLLENGKELWSWLQDGAYFYVCGDAEPMAKEVEATIVQLAKQHGGMSDEDAKAYLKSLRLQKRYLLDVY